MTENRFARAREHFEELAQELAGEGVSAGNLFGKPSLRAAGKAFACQFRDAVAFKLTSGAHAEALAMPGAQLFDPSGKGHPMKEWVQVPVDHAAHWPSLARAALTADPRRTSI